MHSAFQQVDVFTSVPYRGNPVAVVLNADRLTDHQMQTFARWTNLSETTFVLPPSDLDADYRLRIFTPAGELPFAGHPTLGSAHAWLRTAGSQHDARYVVQECGAGLVRIKQYAERLAFAAPPLRRTGPLDETLIARITRGLGIERSQVVAHQWADNGPGWAAVMLDSAQRVLDIVPDFAAMGDLEIGVIGPYDLQHPRDADFEVRAFAPGHGVPEDPVTGSLNAALAQWLRSDGLAKSSYVAAQGTAIGRTGRIYLDDDGTDIWVGGYCTTRIDGTVDI